MEIYKTTMKYKNYPVIFEIKKFELKDVFKISRESKTSINTIQVKICKKDLIGRGECVPYKRYGDNLNKLVKLLKSNNNYNNLQSISFLSLRNALSNAYFDLKLKEKKIPYIDILKKTKYRTAVTIPILNKKKFINEVKKIKNIKIIKIKLDQKKVFDYLNILKKISPKSKIIIDANEGWSISFIKNNEALLKRYNIFFIEQPVKAKSDHLLKSNLPLCADESFYLNKNYKIIKNIYKWVNLKPDKFGSEKDIKKAIDFAKKNKLKIFLGCMVSSSLSIVPSLRFAKYCDVLDLDGSLFLSKDYKFGVKYKKDLLTYDKRFNYGY